MKVIGVDPGTAKSAWVVLEVSHAGMRVSEHGYVDNDDLLHKLRAMGRDDFAGVGVERIQSQGRRYVGNETFLTAEMAGRILEACYPVPAAPISRRKVTGHLCGASCGDAGVREALIARRDLDCGSVSNHGWSALGVAVTYVEAVAGVRG